MWARIVLAWLLIHVFACDSSQELGITDNTGPVNPEADQCRAVDYNEPLTIVAGRSYCLSDGIEFRVVSLNNLFCPCGATCVWEGQMTVSMSWKFPQGDIETVFNSSPRIVDEPLPDGLILSADLQAIEFESACSAAVPTPEILSAVVTIGRP